MACLAVLSRSVHSPLSFSESAIANASTNFSMSRLALGLFSFIVSPSKENYGFSDTNCRTDEPGHTRHRPTHPDDQEQERDRQRGRDAGRSRRTLPGNHRTRQGVAGESLSGTGNGNSNSRIS